MRTLLLLLLSRDCDDGVLCVVWSSKNIQYIFMKNRTRFDERKGFLNLSPGHVMGH